MPKRRARSSPGQPSAGPVAVGELAPAVQAIRESAVRSALPARPQTGAGCRLGAQVDPQELLRLVDDLGPDRVAALSV